MSESINLNVNLTAVFLLMKMWSCHSVMMNTSVCTLGTK